MPSAVPVLLDILRDIPYIDFDHDLTWDGASFLPLEENEALIGVLDWSLPDQLAYSTISALLHLANNHQEHRASIIEAILNFTSIVVLHLKKDNGTDDNIHQTLQ